MSDDKTIRGACRWCGQVVEETFPRWLRTPEVLECGVSGRAPECVRLEAAWRLATGAYPTDRLAAWERARETGVHPAEAR